LHFGVETAALKILQMDMLFEADRAALT
jgi:hypothetical protein